MNTTYRNFLAGEAAAVITHIGLVDEVGSELSGGVYARKSVTWTTPSNGVIRPNADITFDIPAGTTVGGWRGYTDLTEGTDYGGSDLTNESFADAGEYDLIAADTGILHNAGA